MPYQSHMKRAIALALKADNRTDPNPMVGAVLIDAENRVLAEGFHEKAGSPHAEVNALSGFDQAPPDSTLLVTLEPCCHQGKTPPCVDLILQKKVPKVVVGCRDPNNNVAGKGIAKLREAGVEVVEGVLEKECQNINPVFNKHIVHKIPYVSAKAAISLDGKISMASGDSRWITGETARAFGHALRSQHAGIAVGKNTLLKDNPRLNDRESKNPRDPTRVLFDSKGEIPVDSNFWLDDQTPKILIAGSEITKERVTKLVLNNIQVLVAESKKPDPKWALEQLYRKAEISSLLIEGGGELTASFLEKGLVDRLYLFVSGKVVGQSAAPSWCGELNIANLEGVPKARLESFRPLGEDLLITAIFQDYPSPLNAIGKLIAES